MFQLLDVPMSKTKYEKLCGYPDKCDQMVKLFFQYLAFYNNEKYYNRKKLKELLKILTK